MDVSPMTMMALYGVMLVMVKRATVRLPVQVTLFWLFSLIMMMPNLCLVECKTMTEEPCIFPFNYNGAKHYECITHDNSGTPWCDVGTGIKENCMSNCPGKIGLSILCDFFSSSWGGCKTKRGHPGYRKNCAFPFFYHGANHYECITHGEDGVPWCDTDSVGNWGYCRSDCPGKLVLTIQYDPDDNTRISGPNRPKTRFARQIVHFTHNFSKTVHWRKPETRRNGALYT